VQQARRGKPPPLPSRLTLTLYLSTWEQPPAFDQTNYHTHLLLPLNLSKPTNQPTNKLTMTSDNTDFVDETPISPVRSQDRRNSLEKHLQHRPEPQDLKNRHILLDTTTAPYVPKPPHHPYNSSQLTHPLATAPSKPKPSNSSASAQPTSSKRASTRGPNAPILLSAIFCQLPTRHLRSRDTRRNSICI
jgi:hypothetical protein